MLNSIVHIAKGGEYTAAFLQGRLVVLLCIIV
jgi:hypothetical protein